MIPSASPGKCQPRSETLVQQKLKQPASLTCVFLTETDILSSGQHVVLGEGRKDLE